MDGKVVREEIGLAARTDQLVVAREFVARVLKATAMAERDARAVVLAVDEAVANAMQHGQHQTQDVIVIRAVCDGVRFSVTIVDNGESFDVAERVNGSDINMGNHIAAGRKRGLGLFIMRKVMDEVSYAYKDGRNNELTLVKYIRPEVPEMT